jgi:hypothetical protein
VSAAGETFPSDISSCIFSSLDISHSSTAGAYTFPTNDLSNGIPASYNSNSTEYHVYTRGTWPKAQAASLKIQISVRVGRGAPVQGRVQRNYPALLI